jgi:hypothetical protein
VSELPVFAVSFLTRTAANLHYRIFTGSGYRSGLIRIFGQIRILQRAMAVRGRIFQSRSQIGIRVIGNPTDLSTMILHLQRPYSMGRSFENADFQREKWVREP